MESKSKIQTRSVTGSTSKKNKEKVDNKRKEKVDNKMKEKVGIKRKEKAINDYIKRNDKSLIQVGKKYQAEIPEFLGNVDVETRNAALSKSAQDDLLYSPENCHLSDENLEAFIQKAKIELKYEREQTLGMLFVHKFDRRAAWLDMTKYRPIISERKTFFDANILPLIIEDENEDAPVTKKRKTKRV